jgi:hypothetical protein
MAQQGCESHDPIGIVPDDTVRLEPERDHTAIADLLLLFLSSSRRNGAPNARSLLSLDPRAGG